jgi:hypothetical protein
MQTFAELMGRQMADMLRAEYPVVLVAGDTGQCRAIDQNVPADTDDAIYVLTYSETSRSLCLTIYGKVPDSVTTADVSTITSDLGHNYGRPFTGSIRGVPLHRTLTVLSPEYLALLHWRAHPDASTKLQAGQSRRLTSPAAQITFADASIPLDELRAAVAWRHDLVDRALLVLILLASAVLVFIFTRLALIYRRSAAFCRTYDFELQFRDFAMRDLADIEARAIAMYQDHRQRLHSETRLENALRREKQDARLRLESFLTNESPGPLSLRIRDALDNDDLDQMQSLLHELQPQAVEKTPEERLHLMLESLKEYCSDAELEDCQQQASAVLQHEGFRQARETVVRLHDQFRLRSKQQQEQDQILAEPQGHIPS